jgi:hypothetical protein
MYVVLECAVCAVLVFLIGALLFAASAACIFIDEGVRAIAHTTHRTLESAPRALPRLATFAMRKAGTWTHPDELVSFRDTNFEFHAASQNNN